MKWTPERIKALRKALGENQETFAKRFRVTIDALQHWEQGRGSVSGPATVILDDLAQRVSARHAEAV